MNAIKLSAPQLGKLNNFKQIERCFSPIEHIVWLNRLAMPNAGCMLNNIQLAGTKPPRRLERGGILARN
jgi:hypothetical protein